MKKDTELKILSYITVFVAGLILGSYCFSHHFDIDKSVDYIEYRMQNVNNMSTYNHVPGLVKNFISSNQSLQMITNTYFQHRNVGRYILKEEIKNICLN